MTDRRTFLKTLSALTAGIMVSCDGLNAQGSIGKDRLGALLPLRKLGRTGENVTMLGVGGSHIGRARDKEAQKIIETALAGGVRFFDNAESYESGNAESFYGKYLTPNYRDVAFIMTKTTAKDGAGALRHLEDSLRRMKTEYVDLWQIHAVSSPNDVKSRIENSVLKVFEEAKASGKAKHIGFTGHADFNAHLAMVEAQDVLETCQMPINCFDPNYKSFINNVLPKLVERNYGVIAMKTLSNGGFFGGSTHFQHGDNPKIVPNLASIKEAIHFVWSLPVSVLVTGPDNAEMLQEKIDLAKSFVQMDDVTRANLVQRIGDAGLNGKTVEYYKV